MKASFIAVDTECYVVGTESLDTIQINFAAAQIRTRLKPV
jgi:hypothetical protein